MNAILARIRRGYARMWGWAVSLLTRTRAYRYDGEQAAHAEQLRETEIALSMMASATAEPEQVRMASEIEDGAENRLAVLLSRPRLTLAEKRERDAIQAALAARRQGFDPIPAPQPLFAARPRLGFLGAIPAMGSWQVWAAVGAFTMAGWGWGIWQSRELRIERAERREAVRVANENADAARQWRAQYEAAHADVIAAQQQAAATSQNLEAERRRTRASRRRDQERERAIQNVIIHDEPPPLDSLLRHHGADEGAQPGGGDPDSGGSF